MQLTTLVLYFVASSHTMHAGYNRAGLESELVETFMDVVKDAYFRLDSLDPILPIG
jgi:hypothetical protein